MNGPDFQLPSTSKAHGGMRRKQIASSAASKATQDELRD
jgi:hypothetical protein